MYVETKDDIRESISILIVCCIVLLVLSRITGFYVTEFPTTKIELARSELLTLQAHIGGYEISSSRKISTFSDISDLINLPHTKQRQDQPDRVSGPKDPWGNSYRIDIKQRTVYSQGPDFVRPNLNDMTTYFGIPQSDEAQFYRPITEEERLLHGSDDIIVPLKVYKDIRSRCVACECKQKKKNG